MPERTVTILAGLPGSGKSTYLRQRRAGLPPNCCFDNFHECSLDDSSAFKMARCYAALRELLRIGKDCLIADIEYCRTERRLDAVSEIGTISRELGIAIRIGHAYFQNDPDACRHNIVHRYVHSYWSGLSRDYIGELRNVDELSAVYQCPSEGAIPVTRCCSTFGRQPSSHA